MITPQDLGIPQGEADVALREFEKMYPGIAALNKFDDKENERRMERFLIFCSGEGGVLLADPDEDEEDEEWDDDENEDSEDVFDDEDDNDIEEETE